MTNKNSKPQRQAKKRAGPAKKRSPDARVRNWLDETVCCSYVTSHGGKTGRPQRLQPTYRELLDQLSSHEPADTKDEAGALSPGLQSEGKPRRKATGHDAQVLMYDLDGPDGAGLPDEWINAKLDELERRNIAFAAYSSFSHDSKSKRGHSRCRVALFPSEPIADEHAYDEHWQAGAEFFEHQVDAAPSHIAAIFYLPLEPHGASRRWTRQFHGRPGTDPRFDVHEWRRPIPKRERRASTVEVDESDLPPIKDRMADASRRLLRLPAEMPDADGHAVIMRARVHAKRYGVPEDRLPKLIHKLGILKSYGHTTQDGRFALSTIERHGAGASYEPLAEVTFGEEYAPRQREQQDLLKQQRRNVKKRRKKPSSKSGKRSKRQRTENETKRSAFDQIPGAEVMLVSRDEVTETIRKCPADTTMFVVAGVGTGKTHGAAALAGTVHNVLIVAPDQALCRDLAERMGAACYLDGALDDPRLVVTPFSRIKEKVNKYDRDLVVYDEIGLCLERIVGQLCKRPTSTWEAMIRDLATAPRAVAMGADTTPEHATLLARAIHRIRPGRRVVIVLCTEQAIKRHVRFFSTHAAERDENTGENIAPRESGIARVQRMFINALSRRQEGDDPVVWAMDERGRAHVWYESLRNMFPHLRGRVVTGDTSRDDLRDPSHALSGYDYLIVNGAMGTGVDVSGLRVRAIYGECSMRERGGAPWCQLWARFRTVVDPIIRIGIPGWSESYSRPTDSATVRRQILDRNKSLRKRARRHGIDAVTSKEPDLLDMAVEIRRSNNERFANPVRAVVRTIEAYGWTWGEVRRLARKVEALDLSDARRAYLNRVDAAVLNAPHIDDVQYDDFTHLYYRDDVTRAAMRRFEIKEFFGQVSPRLVALDRRGHHGRACMGYANVALLRTHGRRFTAWLDARDDQDGAPHATKCDGRRAELVSSLMRALNMELGEAIRLRSRDILRIVHAWACSHERAITSVGWSMPTRRGCTAWLRSRIASIGGQLKRDGGDSNNPWYSLSWARSWKGTDMAKGERFEVQNDAKVYREHLEIAYLYDRKAEGGRVRGITWEKTAQERLRDVIHYAASRRMLNVTRVALAA